VVLRPERNRAEWAAGVRRSATGRPFQAVGPATAQSDNSRLILNTGDQSHIHNTY